MTGKSRGKGKGGGEWSGDGWKVRGPKLKLRHVAALQTGRWMGKRANTRVPGAFMVLGYPASLVLVLFSPTLVIGVGLLAAVVLWNVSYRSVARPNDGHASRISVAADWATRVSLLVPVYLTWLMLVRWHIGEGGIVAQLRALFGTIFDSWWFLGYATACVTAWLLIFRAPHVVTGHRERKAAEAVPFRGMDDFEGAKVVSHKKTRVGERYRLSIVGTGKAVSEFMEGKLKERLAAKLSLPASRIVLSPVLKNAGLLDVSIRTRDPWAEPLVHPRAPRFEQGRTSITDPIVLGMEPEDGTEIKLKLMTREGGQHVVVIAGTRGGKTTLVNSIIEHLTRPRWDQRDTDICLIDVTKGKDGRAWAPAVAETHMGPENIPAALGALERYAAMISQRAKINRSAVWKIGRTPDRRAKVIILDEASALLANTDQRIAQRTKAAVGYILGKGASEGVIMIVISQRGVLAHLGTNDVHANSFVKIMLRVAKPGEMHYVIPDWQARGMPDMAKYAEGQMGVALVDEAGQHWAAGRTWNLSDLSVIRAIAADRVIKDQAHLTLASAAAAEPDPAPSGAGDPDPAPWGDPDAVTPEAATATLTRELPEDGVDDPDGDLDPDDPDDVPGAPWAVGPAVPHQTRPGRPVTPGLPEGMPRELTDRERRMMGFGAPSTPTGGWKPAAVRKVEALTGTTTAAVSTADHALRVEMSRDPAESAHRWAMRELASAKTDQEREVPEDFVRAVLAAITAEGSTNRARVCQVTGIGKTTVADRLRIMTNRGVLTRSGSGPTTRYTVRVPDTPEG